MTQDEIFKKVQEVLEEALGVDEDEVTMQATLTGDLEAESIDFLDIVFRLEKAFNIKIAQDELFAPNVLQDEAFVQDGKITDKGLAELKERMPHVDASKLEEDRSIEKVGEVFTVEAVVKFVDRKLQEQA